MVPVPALRPPLVRAEAIDDARKEAVTGGGIVMPMTKREKPARGRNAAIVPPLTVDFKTALGALLQTPPPPKASTKPRRRRSTKR
jgi:hypothetical protein